MERSTRRRRLAVVAISTAVVAVLVGVVVIVAWADGRRRDRNERLDDLDAVAEQLLRELDLPLVSNDRLFGGWCLVWCEQHVEVQYDVSPEQLEPEELCVMAESAMREVFGRSEVRTDDPPEAGILQCRFVSGIELADGTRAGSRLTVANSSAAEPGLIHFSLNASP